MAKKGSCGRNPRVGKKGDTKPSRNRRKNLSFNLDKPKGPGARAVQRLE